MLGPLEVVAGGRAVPLRRGRPRKLLLALVLRAGERVGAETLVDHLWGESPPQDSSNALQILVSYLRKVLAAAEANVPARIETTEGGYRLVVDRGAVDALRFADVVAGASDIRDPAERLRVLDEALGWWRGDPLAELTYDTFAQGDIRRLTEARLTAIEARVDALLALGRHAEAVQHLQQLVVEHPLREGLHGQLMLALYRSGRQADALAAYEQARTSLVEELGLDPTPQLRELAQAILEHSPDLRAPAADHGSRSVIHDASPEAAADTEGSPFPQPLTTLIGREDHVVRLLDLLERRRLLTLTGPGGAGKTRLAAELAARTAALGGTVWWIDLSPLREERGVLDVLAAGAGLPTKADERPDDVVRKLSGRRGMLVLDTCEHVLAGVRPLAEDVLRLCPDVTVLATSREPIGVAAELAWPVPPLPLPGTDPPDADEIAASAAVQLFVERASDMRPDFRLTADNAEHVARICHLLDGLPLALELVAGHAAALTPAKIAELLADRFRLPVARPGTGRHHTLRETIEWSYTLLDDEAALFFERLSVFAGPFSVEAGVAVAGHDLADDGLTMLLKLARQSLVATTEGDRFRLLDTVRAYATERLQRRAGESAATAQRHASWYADWALDGRLTLQRPRRNAEELRAEHANFRQAFEWSFSHGDRSVGCQLAARLAWYWSTEAPSAEAARWFAQAKQAVAPGSLDEAHILSGAGMHAAPLGDLRAAVADCTRADVLYGQHGERRSQARNLVFLGIAQWGLGEYDAAADSHDRAIEIFAELRDPGLSAALGLRARTAVDRGEPDALRLLAEAAARAEENEDHHILTVVLDHRARSEAHAGRPDEAARHAERALEVAEQIGFTEGAMGAMNALGLARLRQGRTDEAEALHRRALRLALHHQHPGAIADATECLAGSAVAGGRPVDAVQLLAAADALRQRHGLARRAAQLSAVAALEARIAASIDSDEVEEARRRGARLDLRELATS